MKNQVLLKSLTMMICMFFLVGVASAQHEYVGAKSCTGCHKKNGVADKWKESKHAAAFTDLTSANGKKFATTAGVADATKDAKCTKCHVTNATNAAEGVGCESCHGAGKDYKLPAVMKDKAKAAAAGLLTPNEKTCTTTCHNDADKTHARAKFSFATFYPKIKHKQ